jgi:tetratricopeptide (TPR) repeat protein
MVSRCLFLLGGKLRLKSWSIILLGLLILSCSGPVMAGPGDDAAKQVQELKNRGEFQGALTAANQGLALEPDNLKLNNLVGEIYFSLGKYDSSFVFYSRALQKKGKDSDALYGAGMAALYLKQYDSALDYFKQGEKSGKDKGKFLYGQGLALMEKGDYTNADISFRKATIMVDSEWNGVRNQDYWL